MNRQGFIIAFCSMIVIVAASNYLVQFPINDWLTWGAFTYPISFLVTEITNRFYSPRRARQVAYVGFLLATGMSIWWLHQKSLLHQVVLFLFLSYLIFLYSIASDKQLGGMHLFSPPSQLLLLIHPSFGVSLFWGESLPWITWAIGDFFVKLLVDTAMLTPFRLIMTWAGIEYQYLATSKS